MKKIRVWFYELFEQKVANSLKFMFMDTQRLINESENEILKWQALIDNEQRFLSKLTLKAEEIARERARVASDQVSQFKRDIEQAKVLVEKYNQYKQ
jgi:hypothetical protein